MNYFAHGLGFLDRPHFVAGTAVPDWLSVVDRGVRLRTKQVAPHADDSGNVQAEVAAGVLQHLEDDLWFHRTRGFAETTALVTDLFRRVLGENSPYRHSFLGHICVELVLDGVLTERYSNQLEQYYDALAAVDPAAVQQAVNCMAKHATSRLAEFIPFFSQEQILRDYSCPSRLWVRLNQVMRRIKLEQLPEDVIDVLTGTQRVVRDRVSQLLPDRYFSTRLLTQGMTT